MEKADVKKYFIAGLFCIVGVIATLWFIFTIGADKGLAQDKFQISVLYRNVGGLSEGAPVRLDGVTVGNVDTIGFLQRPIEGRRVEVNLNIFNKYRRVLESSTRFEIKTEGVLGEKLVEIYSKENEQVVDIRKPVIGLDPFEFGDLAQVFAEAADAFSGTANEFGQIDLVALSQSMTDSSTALLSTSEGINGVLSELEDIARKSKRLIDRIEQKIIEGNLFKVF